MENRQFGPAVSGKDRALLLVALLLGFLAFELVLFQGFGISMPVYLVLFYATVFWYFTGKPGGIDSSGLWLLVPIALLSACFALYDNVFLSTLDFLLLIALVALQLATMSGNRLYRSFSLGLLIDLFHAGVALPIVNVPAPFRAMKREQGRSGRKGIGPVLIGLAISVPLLAIVLAMLGSADAVFEKALKTVFSFLNDNVWDYLRKIVLGAIAAIPLYALLHALRYNRKIGSLKRRIDFDRVRAIDPAVVDTVLAPLNAVYVAFVAIQFGYLFNAFSSVLPYGFTYAGYARRGFFELMGVSVINLGVLACTYLFSKRGSLGASAFLKAMETALVALTLLLIASALAKMAMYMDAYGLTPLRVYVAWFLLLLAVFFAAILVKLYVKRLALTRFCGVAFLALFLLLNFADVDGRIAQYDIECYKSGKFKTVDVGMFYTLSDSMVPYAVFLLGDRDPDIRTAAGEVLSDRARIVGDNRWQVYSVARDAARRTLIVKGISYKPSPDRYMD